MPVYISVEINGKYFLLWCPGRRTGVLPSILKTLQELQGGIKSKNGRLSLMDNFWQQTLQAFPPNVSVEAEALSMLAYSNDDLESNQQGGTITDFKPLTQANDLPIRFLNPKLEQAHNNRANEKNVPQIGGNLYDSGSKHPSWEPKVDFSQSFLFTNKQKQNKFPFEVILHVRVIFSTFIPFSSPEPWGMSMRTKRLWGHRTEVLDFRTSGQFRFKSKFEDSLLKALNHLFTVIHTSARASERY